METFVIRIKSWVNNKTYVIRVKEQNRYKAIGIASDKFVQEHNDKLPAYFVN